LAAPNHAPAPQPLAIEAFGKGLRVFRLTKAEHHKVAVIASEPSDFKMKIAAMLEKAKAQSKHLADAAQTPDSATLVRIHTSLADAVKEILAAFPNSVHAGSPNLAEEQQEERPTTGSAR
jgi:hypothetical protein